MINHKRVGNVEFLVELMRKLTTLYANALSLLRKSIKEGMIGSEDVFIGKSAERMESMLNRNGMSINQNWLLRMTRVESFEISVH